jgi:hypothetical protein
LRRGKSSEFFPVKSVNAILGSYPKEAFPALQQAADGKILQAFRMSELPKKEVLRFKRVLFQRKQQYNDYRAEDPARKSGHYDTYPNVPN